MYNTIWKCNHCHHSKSVKYDNKDFDDNYFEEYRNFSKHNCPKCHTQCTFTIVDWSKS